MDSKPSLGKIGWVDLTVPDAARVKDFYARVVGWDTSEVNMGSYSDFCVHTPGDPNPVAGICHARGSNADIPASWLIYITVADVDESLRQTVSLGGRVIQPARDLGSYGKMAVIADPAGAFCAIIQPPSS